MLLLCIASGRIKGMWKQIEERRLEEMNHQFWDSVLNAIGRLTEVKAIMAVKEGMGVSYPLVMLGSLCLLVAVFPVPGWEAFMASLCGSGWSRPLLGMAQGIFQMFAVFAVLGISYKYCEAEGVNPLPAAFLSLAVFWLLLPAGTWMETGVFSVGKTAAGGWLGGKSILLAIFTALSVSWLLCKAHKKDWRLPAPAGVPEGVVRAFSDLLPGLFVFFLAVILSSGVMAWTGVSLAELLNRFLQAPLQAAVDTFAGGILITFLQTLLFWAGVHGPAIVGSLVDPLLTANTLDNQVILDAGGTLLGNPAAHVVTQQINMFATMGGCGMTMGLLLAILLGAKSAQLRDLLKMAGVPGVFNINEPIIFGAPIVFNPYFIVPFIAAPVVCLVVTYLAIATGFMVPFSAVQVLWPTPPIISGFLLAGWQGSLVQAVCLICSTIIYLPFVLAQDRVYCKAEKGE